MCIEEVAHFLNHGATAVIPARIRSFSIPTIKSVLGLSRTTLWRRKQRGRLGMDVVRFVQEQRAATGLPALTPDAEADLLAALATLEDERITKAALTAA